MVDETTRLRRNPSVTLDWDSRGDVVVKDEEAGKQFAAGELRRRVLGAFRTSTPVWVVVESTPEEERAAVSGEIESLLEKGFLLDGDEPSVAGLSREPGIYAEYPMGLTTDVGSFVKPSIHRAMLLDGARTESFRRGIEAMVEPGMTVLEIGAGTGILSFFAARAGAERVYAVEASALAETTRKLLAANGLKERVTLIEGLSYDIELDEPADLLVTETLGHIGFDEGILLTTADARERLLKPGAPILPGNVTLQAVPVYAPWFVKDHLEFWQHLPYGYDTSGMRSLAADAAYVTILPPGSYLAEPLSIAVREMGGAPDLPVRGEAVFEMKCSGTVHGLGLWFESEVAPGLHLDSRQAPSWRQVFLPMDPPVVVQAGEALRVAVELRGGLQEGAACSWEGSVVGDGERSSGGRQE